jgi:hypothetical protein
LDPQEIEVVDKYDEDDPSVGSTRRFTTDITSKNDPNKDFEKLFMIVQH